MPSRRDHLDGGVVPLLLPHLGILVPSLALGGSCLCQGARAILIIISHGGPEGMVIIMAILGISPQGEVTQELRAELRAARAIPRLADEPVALVIIIRVSRRHLERFGEVEFLNEFVLTSQKAAFRTERGRSACFRGRELRSRLGGTTCQATW